MVINMVCIYLKQKQKKYKKYLYCNKLNTNTTFENCSNCEYKQYKLQNTLSKISNKQRKKENNRESIITHDKTKCFICGSKRALTWHEIFRGRNRSNSIKYQLILRLCLNCHKLYQNNKEFNDYWHAHAQTIFEKKYPNENFIKIFHKNYKK